MFGLDTLETLYVVTAFVFQILLNVHYALRKWRFDFAIRYGWLYVYAPGILAAALSVLLVLGDKPWWMWLGGFLYLVWAAYGYTVDYVKGVQWRDPFRWQVAGPYLTLYLATIMFYWWPMAQIGRALWYAQAALFVLSTALNLTSHKRPEERGRARYAS